MAVLKRFEIWLLLGLMAGAVIFALQPDRDVRISATQSEATPREKLADRETSTAPEKPAAASEKPVPLEEEPVVRVEKIRVTKTQQGRLINLTLLGRAEGPEPIDFNSDKDAISITSDKGDVVERFFRPFPDPAVMDNEQASLVNLQYWLRDDEAKFLWVNVMNHKLKAAIPE